MRRKGNIIKHTHANASLSHAKKPFSTRRAFTLVELSLAIAFLSALLLTIAVLINSLPRIYQKGISIEAINYTGQELIDEFTSSFTSATDTNIAAKCSTITDINSRQACESDSNGAGMKFLIQNFSTNQIMLRRSDIVTSNKEYTVPLGGILCSGYYTYIWNSGYVLDESGEYYAKKTGGEAVTSSDKNLRVRYKVGSRAEQSDFRLVRVLDPERNICANRVNSLGYGRADSYSSAVAGSTNTIEINEAIVSDSMKGDGILDILQSDITDANLALYDLNMFQPARSATNGHALYSSSFILATISGAVDITSTGNYCTPPSGEDQTYEFNYCAINKFDFAIRATGGTKL